MKCLKCNKKYKISKKLDCPNCGWIHPIIKEKKKRINKIPTIDVKVERILIALWSLGFDTAKSCQGHSKEGYPWIEMAFGNKSRNKINSLKKLLQYHSNKKNGEWEVFEYYGTIIRPKDRSIPLEKLQKQIYNLGNDILNNLR